MGLLGSAGKLLGFGTVEKGNYKDKTMLSGGDHKMVSGKVANRFSRMDAKNPWDKGVEAQEYGKQADTVQATGDSARRRIDERSQKYGSQDVARRSHARLDRQMADQKARARRQTSLDFIGNRVKYDVDLLGAGMNLAKASSDSLMGAEAQRAAEATAANQANAGAFGNLMGTVASGGMGFFG